MFFKEVIAGVILFLLIASTELEAFLLVDKSPCLEQGVAVYRCIVNEGALDWVWTPVGSRSQTFSVVPNLEPQTRTSTLIIGGIMVHFNITEVSSPISVTATVSNPISLNGTRMTCGGQTRLINISENSLVPTVLRVLRLSDNMSEVRIEPTIERDASGITYQLSSSNSIVAYTNPIMLTVPDTITFFHCQYNTTFTIGTCILQESDEDRNFTLYSNDTWMISQECSPQQILVTCSNDSWCEDISCQESTSSESTNLEFRDVTVTTMPNSFTSSYNPEEVPISCNPTTLSLEIVIGIVIGTFVLALVLGLVLGLLFGVKYLRAKIERSFKKKYDYSNHNINLNEVPQCEQIEVDKNVELTSNICYDTVKNI